MPGKIDLFDAIYTMRAIRHFKPDPIPDSVLRAILEAACQAPSGGNRQPWTFLIIKKKENLERLHNLLLQGMAEEEEKAAQQGRKAAKSTFSRTLDEQSLANIPVIVMVLSSDRQDGVRSSEGPDNAIQNLLLAARAFGLGGVITFVHEHNEYGIRSEFGIPSERDIVAFIPLGYPDEHRGSRHGTKTRKLLEEVAFEEQWGNRITI